MTQSPLDRVEQKARASVAPAPRLNVSDWLDANRVISREYPSPFPGPWRTSRTPYLRDPMNDFIDPAVETLVLLFSSQIGKTEAILGTLLYSYGVDPGPGMLILPTLDIAGAVSTDRLAPALKSCPALDIGASKSRSTENAVLHKRINGQSLTLAGANSTASLSSRPVMRLWGDEIDRWPASTPEGDPLALAEQRTAAYRRRKKVYSSTATIKGASRIEALYDTSDKRILLAPCPRCGAEFEPAWSHVRWTSGEPDTAHMECPECRGEIRDRERNAMFAAARWHPTAPFAGVRGYRTWAIVSPWTRLSEMVASFLKAKEKQETLQAWVNLTRGESWEAPSNKVESANLISRRERFAQEVPAGAAVLTCGVDTQDDRLELLVVGWGSGEESWIISRETVFGDPQNDSTWTELDEVIARPWHRELGGTCRVQCTLVDALGHRTSAVYRAVVARQHRRFYASIGKDGGAVSGQLVSTPKILRTEQGNVLRYIVDASQAKAIVMARLKQEDPSGPGTIHFPLTVGDAFFSELTAEHLITERNRYGVPSQKWARRPGRTRNESLDCYGMALAALHVVCPTPARFEDLAKKVSAAAGATLTPAPDATARPRQPRTRNWTPGV